MKKLTVIYRPGNETAPVLTRIFQGEPNGAVGYLHEIQKPGVPATTRYFDKKSTLIVPAHSVISVEIEE